MPSDIAPIGVMTTAVVTVDATSQVTLFSGGEKVVERVLSEGTIPAPQVVSTLRLGATDPNGLNPSSILVQEVFHWDAPLPENDATQFSANLSYVPPSPTPPKPVVSIPATLTVLEGGTVSIPITKAGTGPCTVTVRTQAGTAIDGTDYTGTTTTVSFLPGDTSKTVNVNVASDAVDDGGDQFAILVDSAINCELGNAAGTVTITEPPSNVTSYAAPVGFATTVDAGVGQTPYYVTSLDVSLTTGTLAHALTQSNKLIVFEVGGRMVMPQSGLVVSGSNLTVAGETAPAPGIIIQGGDFIFAAARNIHLRHLTFERGHDDRLASNTRGSAVSFTNTSTTNSCDSIWFDHCAFLWGNDHLITMWPVTGQTGALTKGILRNLSFTNCIFAEPLSNPQTVPIPGGGFYRGHYEGGVLEKGRDYGFLIGLTTRNVDIQYSLFTDSGQRCPLIDADTTSVIANNVALNCSAGVQVTMSPYDTTVRPFQATIAGYLCISGPDSSPHSGFRITSNVVRVPPAGSIAWVSGLYGWQGLGASVTPGTTPTWLYSTQSACIDNTGTSPRPVDIPNAPVPLLTATQIYQRAKDNVGPRPKERATGPISVQRVVSKLVHKTGKVVNHPTEVGGMSTLSLTTRSLRDGSGTHKDGTSIPAFPTATDKVAVRTWLRRFQDDIQFD